MNPAAISASVAWLLQTFVEQDRGTDGVVSLPELFPQVSVGQVFPPSPSGETVDHKHTIRPNDDLPRSFPALSKGCNCCVEFGSCHWLIFAMQYASSSSQRTEQATAPMSPPDTDGGGGLSSQRTRSRL